jgi:hypothetical protein
MVDDDDRGAVAGMSGKGKRITQKELAPFLLCPPQIPHNMT